jgi:hypothetical protein
MEALHLFEDKYFLIDTTSEGNAILALLLKRWQKQKRISSVLERLRGCEM